MQLTLPAAVERIIHTLNIAGFEAYAVGGCVRDALSGVQPNDWDITTSALPEQTKACFAEERIIETGIKHGTVAIYLEGELYEVTTYRMDGDYLDGRHPKQVEFVSNLRQDLSRRDFTVNAMAYHPDEGLVDPFGGQQDLSSGILRCVGNPEERFTEDALRIMRAVRFASTLGFELEKHTAAAVHALKDGLFRIAMERITAELYKLLCGKAVRDVLIAYGDVIHTIIPELTAAEDFNQNTPYHCYDVWRHTVEAVAQVKNEPVLRLTMLLHDVGKPFCYTETVEYPYVDSDAAITIGHFRGHPEIGTRLSENILKRMRCDKNTIATVTKLIWWHDVRPKSTRILVKHMMAKLGVDLYLKLQEVRKADARAKRLCYQKEALQEIERAQQFANQLLAEHACISVSQLAINGSDLIAAGWGQGQRVGAMLRHLLNLVMDELIVNERGTLLREAVRYSEDSWY